MKTLKKYCRLRQLQEQPYSHFWTTRMGALRISLNSSIFRMTNLFARAMKMFIGQAQLLYGKNWMRRVTCAKSSTKASTVWATRRLSPKKTWSTAHAPITEPHLSAYKKRTIFLSSQNIRRPLKPKSKQANFALYRSRAGMKFFRCLPKDCKM